MKIDGKTLNVRDLTVEVIPALTEWDAWEDGSYKRKIKAFGGYRVWRLDCYEETSVSWTDSIIKYLQDKITSGSTVTLDISETAYTYNGSAYIKELAFTPDNTEKVRRYTVTLQET